MAIHAQKHAKTIIARESGENDERKKADNDDVVSSSSDDSVSVRVDTDIRDCDDVDVIDGEFDRGDVDKDGDNICDGDSCRLDEDNNDDVVDVVWRWLGGGNGAWVRGNMRY